MLNVYEQSGQKILAPDPFFPIVLSLQNALFDVIFTAEASQKLDCFGDEQAWVQLIQRWKLAIKRTGILD